MIEARHVAPLKGYRYRSMTARAAMIEGSFGSSVCRPDACLKNNPKLSKANQETMECGPCQAEDEHHAHPHTNVSKGSDPVPSFDSMESLQESLADDVIGMDERFNSPLGTVPLVYADHTASNRPMKSIESYLQNVCLPLYGNTHTNTSLTGSQSTAFVAEARQIIAESTNAKITGKASSDVVLFAGSGATAAVELLIDCLGISAMTEELRPVIFIGPYEHHSNLIPWRESGCEVVMIPERHGTVDLEYLERELCNDVFAKRLKMGTFTAASNVTGKLCDVNSIGDLLHKHNALAFFDYATASSYTKIDMNPVGHAAKDAIFLSPHKLLGGVGTPGILIVKKQLVSQVNPPKRSGGGTVFYVTNEHHRFLSHRVERYEGGTPMIPGILRAGLTFLTKRQVERQYEKITNQDLLSYETNTRTRIVTYLAEHAPELVVLGSDDPGPHLPIVSFLIRYEQRFLHYNFVCAVLNDVFGIQSRGGCQCAGPYSQVLLGLSGQEANVKLENALCKYKERAELLRPGYTRVSFPFKGMRNAEMDYILKAMVWVAKHGWALLCQYRCNHRTGEWRHSTRQGRPFGRDDRRWLSHFQIGAEPRQPQPNQSSNVKARLEAALVHADQVLESALTNHQAIAEAAKMVDADHVLGGDGDDDLESLRWYVYPQECAKRLLTVGTKISPTATGTGVLGALRPRTENVVRPLNEDQEGKTDLKPRKVLPDVQASSSMVCFRDGSYTGEASMADISAGIDDGELSSRCEVLDIKVGEWVLFGEMQRARQRKSVQETNTVEIPLSEETNHKKKAPRTPSDWGKAGVSHEHLVKAKLEPVKPMEAEQLKSKKKKRFLHTMPPAKMMRLTNQAIVQWEMIKDGDKLLLGLSGGKDSLSLLHCLMELKRKLPINFELEVCTIDPMTESFDPSPLIPYVESLGLKYHYIKDNIVERANEAGDSGAMVSSLCAFCARMKRGLLYTCARTNNCNKLVLAQHLDDCAESLLMSMMHNGLLRTMKANYTIDAGDLAVIRPFVYCRESSLTDFAKKSNLPIINENCPACFEEPKERVRIKKLLSREETLYPNVYDNIRRALLPLMHDDTVPILRSFAEEVVAKSRKEKPQETLTAEAIKRSGNVAERKVMDMSDSELLAELARRRRNQGQPNVASTQITGTPIACSIKSGEGTIPCYELME